MHETLIAGDTLDFSKSVTAYPATSGWTLKYRLIPRTSGTAIDITAAADGEDYRVQVAPGETANWVAAEYSWTCWVEKTGARYTVDSGTCTIIADPATLSAYDGRSQAQVALEAAQAALATFNATSGRVKRYSIAGREMEFDNSSELVKLVSYWQSVVNREAVADALRRGQADPRRIYLRAGHA